VSRSAAGGRHGCALARRRFLIGAGAVLGAPFIASRTFAAPAFAVDPFALGVASGCPRPDGVVLWTRLAPAPLDGGGMPDMRIEVAWEIATDPAFARVVARGTAPAIAAEAHSVHVEVMGLAPDRPYWYRFHAGDATSPVGRTRTASAPGAPSRAHRFAVASCQHYEHGHFAAYRHMAAEDLDLVLHLGDYIYERSWGQRRVRRHNAAVPTELAEYRDRYALYKSDPDLQAAHAAGPWVAIWDDHEVDNDYTNDRSPGMSDRELFLRRRAAAYQAWWEHMPVPRAMAPQGPSARIYAQYRFGHLIDLLLLDDRQYRAHHACSGGRGGSALFTDCGERLDPSRSMLGGAQERWLADALARPGARWTLIAQQTLMAEVNRGGEPPIYWMDGWDGYPAARQRLIERVEARPGASAIVLGGDVHTFMVNDLKREAACPVVASEFVTSSITSEGPAPERVNQIRQVNPHVKYARGDRRGYLLLELIPGACVVHLESIEDVSDSAAAKQRLASFVVEAGRPGAVPA
jgi:alkaline phosphatase D